jgi:hypothetical protein
MRGSRASRADRQRREASLTTESGTTFSRGTDAVNQDRTKTMVARILRWPILIPGATIGGHRFHSVARCNSVRRFQRVRATALGVAVWALSACFTYTTAVPSAMRIGERVRVRVSGAEADRLEATLGQNERTIEGEVLEQADSSIALGVAIPVLPDASSLSSRPQQRVVIPRAEVQEIELRRLDKVRTSLLVGAAVAAVAAIAASKGSSLLGGGGNGGTPNERRVPVMTPVMRWRLPLP